MSEWKDNEETSITYGNGSSETAKEGELTGITCNKYGQELSRVKMKGVKYVPESAYNLFSVTQRVNQGWQIGGDKTTGLYLKKGQSKIVFDIIIKAGSGLMACLYIKRDTNIVNSASDKSSNSKLKASSEYSRQIPTKLAHDLFGHCDEARTRKMAKAQGFKNIQRDIGTM